MELAKRAVLDVLDGILAVDAIVRDDIGAGVDCTGARSSSGSEYTVDSMRLSDSASDSDTFPAESSNAGREGKDGISAPSAASIRRHTREGVSSIPAIVLEDSSFVGYLWDALIKCKFHTDF